METQQLSRFPGVGDDVPDVARPGTAHDLRLRPTDGGRQFPREVADGVRFTGTHVEYLGPARFERRPQGEEVGPRHVGDWTKSRRCRPSSITFGAVPFANADRKIEATPAYGVSRGILGPYTLW
jgi:hypothetical protein